MPVVDAGALFLAFTARGKLGDDLRGAFSSAGVFAPEVLDLEILSVTRRHERSGLIPAETVERVARDLERSPIVRHSVTSLLPRCWELRHTVTAFDAAYVALAEATDEVLLTTDAKLANAPGPRCRFELVG